jgi:hypothetical protein
MWRAIHASQVTPQASHRLTVANTLLALKTVGVSCHSDPVGTLISGAWPKPPKSSRRAGL